MSCKNEIIDYCITNRVSTTEVADALGKNGVMPKIQPVNLNLFCVGTIRTVFASNNSNYAVHEQIRDIQKGDIVIIFAHGCDDRAIIGGLISKYILLYKGASAIIVQGLVRDAAELRREGYSVWAEGLTPLGCFNTPNGPFPVDLENELRDTYEGGVAVCDDGGVTLIKRDLINNETLSRLRRIEMQEDLWYFCLDTLKWDTKKIVCDKAYLSEQGLLSSTHIEQLNELLIPLDASRDLNSSN